MKRLFIFLLALSLIGVLGIERVEAYDDIPLLAGQDEQVGHVEVWNDYENIYVKYVMDPDWCLMETNLHVITNDGEFPINNAGNPITGHFDYKEKHECIDEKLYTIEDLDFLPDQIYKIAAHAKVRSVSSETINEIIYSDEKTLYYNGTDWVAAVPVELLHTQWTAKRIEWNMLNSDWLWDGDYEPLATPKTVNFLREIVINGEPISAELKATADNTLLAYLESNLLFTNTVWTNMPTRDIDLNEGLNNLKFDVTNYAGGTWTNNPGGLLYELSYSYHPFIYESAWADGDRFVTKGNWATFFSYTIEAPTNLLQTAHYVGTCNTFGTYAGETLTFTFSDEVQFTSVYPPHVKFLGVSTIGTGPLVWTYDNNEVVITTTGKFITPRPKVGDFVSGFNYIVDKFGNPVEVQEGGIIVTGDVTYPTREWSGPFVSTIGLLGEWEYNVVVEEDCYDGFMGGTIVLTGPGDQIIEGEIEDIKDEYPYWDNMSHVSKPNFAAVGTAEYGTYTGNFMFLIADSHIWLALSEEDYTDEWANDTVWVNSDRDYQVWSADGDFWYE